MTRRRTLAAAPGLLATIVLAGVAFASTLVLPGLFGAVTIGLFLGIVVANVRPMPLLDSGARLARSWFLPIGIVLLGARLSLGDILSTGLGAIAVLVVDVVLVLGVTLLLGRALGLSPQLSTLIAVGTGICGNTAIVATSPLIAAEDRDVSFAVATITLFGTAAVVVYPLVGHALGMSDVLFGHWAGAAVNDTSQVAATAFSYSVEAGETATIVKLTRNTLMAPLILGIGLWMVRARSADAAVPGEETLVRSMRKALPPFLLGFLALALVNSAGLIPAQLADGFVAASQVFIVAALAGVGLSTRLASLRRTGPAPFVMGLAVAVGLALVSLSLFVLLGVG